MKPASRASLVAGVERAGGAPRAVIDPFDGAVIAEVADARTEDVAAAIDAAERGARACAALAPHARAAFLARAAALLGERKEKVALQLSREAGKPLRDARVEVERCGVTLQASAEEAKRIGGEVIPIDGVPAGQGRVAFTRRFPIGIVTAITPFNFPLNLAAHKAAPALAAGNAMILKPAPRTPLSAFALADLLLEAGCPAEAIAVVPGDPPVIDPLIDDARIAMVSFTGSAAVGWRLKARAAKKKVTLELGGNAAAIVHRDAELDLAAARCVAGSFTYAGQVCIRSQRLLLHAEIADAFLERFLARVRALKRGRPADEATELGPMIDAAAAQRAHAWVREAVGRGAMMLIGGEPEDSYLPPTVLEGAPPDCKASCEEIFAPVVTVDRYDDADDALRRAAATRYGLQAGLFTNDLALVMRAFETLPVGALIHNDVPMFRTDTMPYGGVRDSGFGREGVRYAVEDMTEARLLILRPDPRR